MRAAILEYFEGLDDIDVCGIAASAEEALEGLESADPSLVLLDISLPGRNGLELLGQIRREWELPCVVLTGHVGRSPVANAFEAGAGGYVLKGIPDDLEIAVRTVADGGTFISEPLAPVGNGRAPR